MPNDQKPQNLFDQMAKLDDSPQWIKDRAAQIGVSKIMQDIRSTKENPE